MHLSELASGKGDTMGAKRNITLSSTTDVVKKIDIDQASLGNEVNSSKSTKKNIKKNSKSSKRSKKYVSSRSLIDKSKSYDLGEAIALVKKTSYSKFVGTITADVLVREIGEQTTLTFPHNTGKSIRVAIANDQLIEQISSGKIDFDILLSTPEFVPKLAKFAKVLGPRGLMPNPKNGTITQQAEEKKKELEAGKLTIKTEKKAPLAHVAVGKTDMKDDQLIANVRSLIESLDFRLKKITLSATMGPAVKVKID